MVPITLSSPIVQSYIVYSAILALKLLALTPMTATMRLFRGTFANPEDAKMLKGKVRFDDPIVERIRRAHLNDLENIPAFWVLGALYVTTGPVAAWATLLFRVYTVCRIIHTIVYAVVPLPQPARGIAFGIPFFISLYMGAQQRHRDYTQANNIDYYDVTKARECVTLYQSVLPVWRWILSRQHREYATSAFLNMASISLEAPSVQSYMFYSGVLALKMMGVSLLTARARYTKKVFANEEDAKRTNGKVKYDDPDVERVRRAHLNDLENIPAFWVVGALYLTTGPAEQLAISLFRAYAAGRILHTFVYAVKPLPQPARGIAFGIPFFITIFMGFKVVQHYFSAL